LSRCTLPSDPPPTHTHTHTRARARAHTRRALHTDTAHTQTHTQRERERERERETAHAHTHRAALGQSARRAPVRWSSPVRGQEHHGLASRLSVAVGERRKGVDLYRADTHTATRTTPRHPELDTTSTHTHTDTRTHI
jgi:hypothetical protein